MRRYIRQGRARPVAIVEVAVEPKRFQMNGPIEHGWFDNLADDVGRGIEGKVDARIEFRAS
ncbi:MAG: hypothetical protein ACREHV_13635 [Rhizomicrobium sp.]